MDCNLVLTIYLPRKQCSHVLFKESTMPNRLHHLKRSIFDIVVFVLFLIAVAKLLYYELWH